MTSVIKELDINGEIKEVAIYSLEPKSAMIAFIMQNYDNDYNTWNYPDVINGMWKSDIADVWYYDDGKIAYGSFPRKE